MSRQFRGTDTDKWKYGFGGGAAGAGVISSNSSYSTANAGVATVASGNTAITLDGASTFANGDLVLIHQTKGTGAGAWELNKILSGGGTTSITLKHATQNNYTDSGANPGASQCQMLKITEYDTLVINSGITWSAPAWDGNVGGIIAVMAKTSVTVNGAISLKGLGFRASSEYKNSNGPVETNQGEGSGTGIHGTTEGRSANGTGGGGGGAAGGDGGGNGSGGGSGAGRTNGSNGYNIGYSTASGGVGVWDTNGALISLGGGAGGRVSGGAGDAGSAGTNGSAIMFVFTKAFVISATGSINLNTDDGNTGGDSSTYSSGAGGAGSIIIGAETIDINTLKITAVGGAAKGGGKGGDGGIVCMYSKTFNGTSNPTVTSFEDTTIRSLGGAGMLLAF
jgi:hypothetical protein